MEQTINTIFNQLEYTNVFLFSFSEKHYESAAVETGYLTLHMPISVSLVHKEYSNVPT